jgi:hypothetical protein
VRLGVVTQWLKVANAHDRLAYGFKVSNAPWPKVNSKPKALLKRLAHNLELYLAHQSQANLLEFLAPGYAQHRVFVGHLAQRCQHSMHIARPKLDSIGEHRSKPRARALWLGPKGIPWYGMRKPSYSAELACVCRRHNGELGPFDHTNLIDLLAPRLASRHTLNNAARR